MVFSSHIFLFYFLPLALLCYFAAPRVLKHLVLTLFSYLFYGWWEPWFVFLMLGSTAVDYFCGWLISGDGASGLRRKAGLYTSIFTNLALLGFFKYAGFFSASVTGLAGLDFPSWIYAIILPVGISFYTFQSMSYSIDLYRGDARPAKSFIDFACYVSMFPQLVAGPIVRYHSVSEQLRTRVHTIDGFILGVARFQIGFAKKIILANSMGAIATDCFQAGGGSLSVASAWVGIVAYAFQIYFDFSGYSDMALGLGRMFGFRFPENFHSPYRSQSITEFWRRWHISLSTFLRDYLYIPLGGNRKGAVRTYGNLLTVMILGGLWHGAAWTFLAWGAIHGLLLAFERMTGRNTPWRWLPKPLRIAVTFGLILITWVFFRAENFTVAMEYLQAMFGQSDVRDSARSLDALVFRPSNIVMLVVTALIVWAGPRTQDFLRHMAIRKLALSFLLFLLALGLMFTQGFNPFLYFQF